MEAVPLTLFLARRDRDYEDLSGIPKPIDIQAATEAWYEKGLVEGMEKARAACDAAIAKKEEECRANMEQARRAWARTEGAQLAQQIGQGLEALKAEIEAGLVRVLTPLMAQSLIDEALAKVAVEIGKLLLDDDAIKLKIFGPSDLVSQLSKRIPPSVAVALTAKDQPEVTVFANKTVIETRLTEWLARLGVHSHAEDQEGQRSADTEYHHKEESSE
ncbi:MAG: hypothetical protein WAN43_17060 [Rhodomicrobium sp.]|jgi:hypothetical protein